MRVQNSWVPKSPYLGHGRFPLRFHMRRKFYMATNDIIGIDRNPCVQNAHFHATFTKHDKSQNTDVLLTVMFSLQ